MVRPTTIDMTDDDDTSVVMRLLHTYSRERRQTDATLTKMIEAIGGTVDGQTKVQEGIVPLKLKELEKLVAIYIFARNEAHNE